MIDKKKKIAYDLTKIKEEKEMNVMEKVKGLSKKKKVMVAAFLILAAGGATGSVVYASQSQQKLDEAQAVVDKQYSVLQELEKEIQSLFDEKDPAFLAEAVTADQINALKSKISAANKNYSTIDIDLKKIDTKGFSKEKTTAEEQLGLASEKLLLQEKLNGLFSEKDKKAIKGSTIDKDLAIIDDLNEKTVKSVKEWIDEASESTFDQAALSLVGVAEGQLKQISTAKKAVEKVYKDKKVLSTDSKLYDATKKEVDKVKNAASKKSLLDQLAIVKKDIDKKAAEKKVADEKKKQETAQVEQAQAAGGTTAGNQAAATDQAQTVPGVDSAEGYAPAAGNDYSNNEYYGNNNDYAAQPTTPAPSTPAAPSNPATPSAPSTPSTGSGDNTATPQPEVPYPLFQVGGTAYSTEAEADAAGIAGGSRYSVYTVPYSDGSTKYHLVINR